MSVENPGAAAGFVELARCKLVMNRAANTVIIEDRSAAAMPARYVIAVAGNLRSLRAQTT